MRLTSALLAVLALCLNAYPSQAAPPARPALAGSRQSPAALALVRYIYRGLAVQPPQQAKRPGRKKMPLFDRYFLQTQHDEKASIGFHDGTVLQINQNTDAVLQSPHVTVVRRGEVAEYLAAGTSHRVQTQAAVAGAIGTTYDVRVQGARSTFIVLHGALQVQNGAGSVVVKSNHETVVLPNQPPSPPTPADARAAFAWTAGIPTPDLGEDIALDANGGTVVGFSSQRAGPGDAGQASHIDDGLLTEGWETATGKVANQWVKVGFYGGNFYRISDIIIDPAATYGEPASEDLKDFELRVSATGTDDASFTTVFRGTCKQQDSLQHFRLPLPLRARYAELVALDNYGSPRRIAVAEWEVVANTSLFAEQQGIAADPRGDVYVADTINNRVDKLSPSGKLLAQWGRKGRAPGQFLRPESLALDRQGNIYVADTFNHRIQKLSPAGKVLATFGSSGVKPGQLLFPHGVAVDGSGNIYVSDTVNRVQKFSARGTLLAIWSDLGSLGTFNFPEGIAIDRHGTVLVADSLDNRIVKLSARGAVLGAIGTAGTHPGQFNQPAALAVDAKNDIFVADSLNDRVEKIDARGRVSTYGTGGSGRGQFILPEGVAADGRGNVYVSDTGNSRLQKLSPAGKVLAVWGKYATVPQVLGDPGGVAVDNRGNVYITDALNDRVQERGSHGQVEAVYGYHGFVAGDKTQRRGQFWYPHGIAVDPQGAIYVADTSNSRVQILSNKGPIAAFGGYGSAPGQFVAPWGVAVHAAGDIYVTDSGNSRVQVFSPQGQVLRVFGTYGTGAGQFVFPMGIAIDHQGNVYVADMCSPSLHPETCNPAHFYGGRVQKFTPDGKLLSVWGQSGTASTLDNLGRFFSPMGLAVDAQDNVYVADSGDEVVQKIAPDGKLLAVYQLPGPNAQPVAVALDDRGNVYVADSLNSRVVEFAPTGELLAIWD